jgi:ribosomal-protein-alanine N-acetyltransferase
MRKFPYSTRPATPDDLDQVAEIERRSIVPPWTRAAFEAELAKTSGRFWVLTDDETDTKVVAYAVFSFPADQAHLVTFAVHSDFRRQGLGVYLLRRLIAYVMRKGGASVYLEVRKSNFAAVQLYQSLGFVVVRTVPRFYPDGEDAYAMIFQANRERLTGEPEVDFENDPDDTPGRGDPKTFN